MDLRSKLLYALACFDFMASSVILGFSLWALRDANKHLDGCKKLLEEIETTTTEMKTTLGEKVQ